MRDVKNRRRIDEVYYLSPKQMHPGPAESRHLPLRACYDGPEMRHLVYPEIPFHTLLRRAAQRWPDR